MNVRKEIELAIKRENPDWDGKSFDYGIAIYRNALECYEAIEPIIEKAGHSGFSYGMFCNVFDRILRGKPLTPIADEDFFSEEQRIHESPEYLIKHGLISSLQCPRCPSLFRGAALDGKVTYEDVDRISVVDQHGNAWRSGWAERCCREYIPEITMPYMPSDEPIRIYAWEFTYKPEQCPSILFECGTYDSMFVDRIEFPDGKTVKVGKMFLHDSDKPCRCTKEFREAVRKAVEKDIEERKE